MKRFKSEYLVTTEMRSGDRYTYREVGYTAQDAVKEVRRYTASDEKIVEVYRKVENWK